MIEKDITISNKLGLHARASAKLVQTLHGFQASAFIACRGKEVNAKSIMKAAKDRIWMPTSISTGTRARVGIAGSTSSSTSTTNGTMPGAVRWNCTPIPARPTIA